MDLRRKMLPRIAGERRLCQPQRGERLGQPFGPVRLQRVQIGREHDAVGPAVGDAVKIGQRIPHGVHQRRPRLRDGHAAEHGNEHEHVPDSRMLAPRKRLHALAKEPQRIQVQRIGHGRGPHGKKALKAVLEGVHARMQRDVVWQRLRVAGIQQGHPREGQRPAEGTLGLRRVVGHDGPGRDLAARAAGGRNGRDGQHASRIAILEQTLLRNIVCRKYRDGLCRVQRRAAAHADDEIRAKGARLFSEGATLPDVGVVCHALGRFKGHALRRQRRLHIGKRPANTSRPPACHDKRPPSQRQQVRVLPHRAAAKAHSGRHFKRKPHDRYPPLFRCSLTACSGCRAQSPPPPLPPARKNNGCFLRSAVRRR